MAGAQRDRSWTIKCERPSPAVFAALVAHAQMMSDRKKEASQQAQRAEAERRQRAEKLSHDAAALQSVNVELAALQEEYTSLDAQKHELFAQLKRALSEADAKRKRLEQIRQQQKKDELEVLSRIGNTAQGPSSHSPRSTLSSSTSLSAQGGRPCPKRPRSPSLPSLAGAGRQPPPPPPPPPGASPRKAFAQHSHSTPNYRSPYYSSPSSNSTGGGGNATISSPVNSSAGGQQQQQQQHGAAGISPAPPFAAGCLPPPPPAPSKNLLQAQERQMHMQHGVKSAPASRPQWGRGRRLADVSNTSSESGRRSDCTGRPDEGPRASAPTFGKENRPLCEPTESAISAWLDSDKLDRCGIGAPPPPSSPMASSGPDAADTCAVCLNELCARGEIGIPEACEAAQHCFCFVCIREWARVTNSCPIDRKPFRTILLKNTKNGPVIMRVPAPRRRRAAAANDDDDANADAIAVAGGGGDDFTPCEVCGGTDGEDTMLLCDACDAGYHMACLDPPLAQVPHEQWFCPECRDDNQPLAQRLRQAHADQTAAPARRLLVRTEQAERVRHRVRQLMEEADEDDDDGDSDDDDEEDEGDGDTARNPSSSDDNADGDEVEQDDGSEDEAHADEVAEEEEPSTSAAAPRRRKKAPARRRRRRTTKRRSGTKTKPKSTTTTTSKRRKATKRRAKTTRRKRRGRKAAGKTASVTTPPSRRRLAAALGVSPPRPGHFLPRVSAKSSASTATAQAQGANSAGHWAPAAADHGGLLLFGSTVTDPCFGGSSAEGSGSGDTDDGEPLSRNARKFDMPIRARAARPAAEARAAAARIWSQLRDGQAAKQSAASSNSSAAAPVKSASAPSAPAAQRVQSAAKVEAGPVESKADVPSDGAKCDTVPPAINRKQRSEPSGGERRVAHQPPQPQPQARNNTKPAPPAAASAKKKPAGDGRCAPAAGGDLLEGIFHGQKVLHAPTACVTIHRDGSLAADEQRIKALEEKQRRRQAVRGRRPRSPDTTVELSSEASVEAIGGKAPARGDARCPSHGDERKSRQLTSPTKRDKDVQSSQAKVPKLDE